MIIPHLEGIFFFFGEEKKESVKLIKCLFLTKDVVCDHTSVSRDFFFLSRKKRKCNINKVSIFDEGYSV